MSAYLRAPFSEQDADNLNRFQASGKFHPFTCVRGHEDRGHVSLVAVAGAGWICPVTACDYTQEWAHAAMADPALLDTSWGLP